MMVQEKAHAPTVDAEDAAPPDLREKEAIENDSTTNTCS